MAGNLDFKDVANNLKAQDWRQLELTQKGGAIKDVLGGEAKKKHADLEKPVAEAFDKLAKTHSAKERSDSLKDLKETLGEFARKNALGLSSLSPDAVKSLTKQIDSELKDIAEGKYDNYGEDMQKLLDSFGKYGVLDDKVVDKKKEKFEDDSVNSTSDVPPSLGGGKKQGVPMRTATEKSGDKIKGTTVETDNYIIRLSTPPGKKNKLEITD
ncbi:MAG TPA: hypothetical protein VFH51_02340, partial [Myxococcota bacterium]|nr:hypothetical protein [Myxococcota bacterium]